MGRTLGVVIASFLAGFVVAAAASAIIFDQTIYNYFGYGLLPSTESYPMRVITSDSSIPVYRGLPSDKLLVDAYPAGEGTRDEIEAWKKRVVDSTYGHNLHASSFEEKPVLEQTLARDGYILERHTMNGLLDDRIIFWKMVPDEPVDKAVMVIPGSGNQGARDVMGEPSPWEAFYYHDRIGVSLVREGYTVYVPELYGYGERAIIFEGCAHVIKTDQILTCGPRTLDSVMASRGGSLGDLWNDENSKVLSAISESKVAVAGLSLGGGLATNQLNINHDRIDAGLIVSGGASWFHAPIDALPNRYNFTTYDTNDIILALVPKPVYLSYGLYETGSLRFEAESGHTYNLMQEAYGLYGMDDSFAYMVHEGGHEYHVPSVLEFLENHL